MTPAITRHFVAVGERRVHYTRAGAGPAVVLLHESPCSAKSLTVPQAIFAERFTAIALDTPGFGLSDPLAIEVPEIADFADALAETLTAMGLETAAVYGRHTGASIAAEFALRHPDRCAMAVVDGYPMYSGPQRESRLTEYLLPLVPHWDGTHLIWLWFRYREQHVFWPWHGQTGAQRGDCDVPDLDFLHRGVIEFLEAGDGYRVAYAAAFRHGGQALSVVERLRVPACFAAREGDSLFRTLPMFPPGTWIAALSRDEAEASRQTMALLDRHPARPAPPSPESPALVGRTVLGMAGGLFLRRAGMDRPGRALLVLHELPGSSATLDGLVLALGRSRHVVAFDMPGQGESPASEPVDPAAWAAAVLVALDALGLGEVDVYAQGTGGVVAAELLRAAPGRIGTSVFGGPSAIPAEGREAFAACYAPDAAPVWDGSHLLRVWHHLRDQELWWPWYERTRAAAREGALAIDPAWLTMRARECLRHPTRYRPVWQMALAYPLREALGSLPGRKAVIAGERDLFGRFAAEAAALAGCDLVSVPAGADEVRAGVTLDRIDV